MSEESSDKDIGDYWTANDDSSVLDLYDQTIGDDDYVQAYIDAQSPCQTAVHRLSVRVHSLGITRQAYYEAEQDIISQQCAHADGGSMVSTTHNKALLWHYREGLDHHVLLCVADNNAHVPVGIGYLKLPMADDKGSLMFPCYYTPSMPATIISPDAIGRFMGCRGYSTISNFDDRGCNLRLFHWQCQSQDILIPLTLVRGLLYTDRLIPPVTESDRTSPRPSNVLHARIVTTDHDKPPPAEILPKCSSDITDVHLVRHIQRCGYQLDVDIRKFAQCCSSHESPALCSTCRPINPAVTNDSATVVVSNTKDAWSLAERMHAPVTYQLCHLGCDQLRALWHQCLGHLHYKRISNLHRSADGIPPIATSHELDKCPVCLAAKLGHHARGTNDSARATECNQGISIDTGFVVQRSTDSERYARSVGLNSETCYCLITDHYSRTLYGQCFASKTPPIAFLNQWLATHGCPKDTPNKYVRLDQGGELAGCHAVITDTSSSNGLVE